MAINLESKSTIYEKGSFNQKCLTRIQRMIFKLVGHQPVEFVTIRSREKVFFSFYAYLILGCCTRCSKRSDFVL